MLIRDGDRGGEGAREWRLDRVHRPGRPRRPWTAATRITEMLGRCPLAIAQQLVCYAVAVSTTVLGQSRKDNVRCTAVEEQLEAKKVLLSQPSSTSLLMISSGLTRGSSSTFLLLISPGPCATLICGTMQPGIGRWSHSKHRFTTSGLHHWLRRNGRVPHPSSGMVVSVGYRRQNEVAKSGHIVVIR